MLEYIESMLQGKANMKKIDFKIYIIIILAIIFGVMIYFYAKDDSSDYSNYYNYSNNTTTTDNTSETTTKVTVMLPYPAVNESVDYIQSTGIKVTVEGFPPCLLGEYTKYIVDLESANFKMLFHNFILPNYANFMSANTRILGENCKKCVYKQDRLCGGIYKEYIEKNGRDEFTVIPPVTERY